MKLSDLVHGRDNNFMLLRMVAAYMVLTAHSFAVFGRPEPFHEVFGMPPGLLAVHTFFIASGFLITRSLLTRGSVTEFLSARFMRIYPALLPLILLTVFGLGLFFTTQPVSAYLTDLNTYKYLAKGLIMIRGISDDYLPGVFENNPVPNAINNSLWTLPVQLTLDVLLVVLWMVFKAMPRFHLTAFKLTVSLTALLSGVVLLLAHFHILEFINTLGYLNHIILYFMFFTGATFYIFRDRIVLSRTVFAVFAVALVLASFSPRTFFPVYAVTLAYIMFYIVYIPSGFIRKYNNLGDYSYGVYIYGFPVQQSIIALVPGISVLSLWIAATIVTLSLAIPSWHLIENPAMKQKRLLTGRIEGLLARINQIRQTGWRMARGRFHWLPVVRNQPAKRDE